VQVIASYSLGGALGGALQQPSAKWNLGSYLSSFGNLLDYEKIQSYACFFMEINL
tara:strand:- start:35 stop:199 length:165 start_codon:yes stop_codon:yes gene_type:complete